MVLRAFLGSFSLCFFGASFLTASVPLLPRVTGWSSLRCSEGLEAELERQTVEKEGEDAFQGLFEDVQWERVKDIVMGQKEFTDQDIAMMKHAPWCEFCNSECAKEFKAAVLANQMFQRFPDIVKDEEEKNDVFFKYHLDFVRCLQEKIIPLLENPSSDAGDTVHPSEPQAT